MISDKFAVKSFIILILFLFLPVVANAFDIIQCCGDNEKPKLVKVDFAPSSGPYIKIEPYHVTAGQNDPYSEEVLFFMIARDMQKEMSFIIFHKYFKEQMSLLEQKHADDPGFFLTEKELYPIIFNYLKLSGNEIPRDIFNDYVKQQQSRIEGIKRVFAFKASTTYYQVSPPYTKVELEKNGSLPTVTLKNDFGILRTTIAANKISVYDEKKIEENEKKSLVETYKEDLFYIRDALPETNAPLRKHLERLL